MYVKFESDGDWSDTTEWLAELLSHESRRSILEEMGIQGVRNLRATTPRDTGITADSWKWNTTLGIGQSEVSWSNSAHPHMSGSLVRMLYYGYSNRTGGYIPPRDFISPAIDPVFKQASKRIEESMKNG